MKTKSRSRKSGSEVIDAAALRRARAIAAKYRLVFEPAAGVGYVGHAVELPGVMADGRTLLECVNATRFAIETAVATMLDDGLRPPSTSVRSRRTEQINLRLSSEEKAILAEECAQRGFRGLSDFVRSLALDGCKRSIA